MQDAGLPPGVLLFERGWLSANNVLFLGKDQTALVDTGYVSHADQTLALVEDALGPRGLDRILNTHLHSDHCGGNADLQRLFPFARTEIPPGEAPSVAAWDEDALSYRATGQNCTRFRFDSLLIPGDDCQLADRVWQIHAAPGHDPHSIILFEPQSRTLISADALWENGFGVAFPELAGEPSFDDVAATLDLIDALRAARVIPGHGRMFCDVATALATARRRLEGLARNPQKHARHAVKVLVKFKLLEAQAMSTGAWNGWTQSTPYLTVIRDRFFPEYELQNLCDEILAELVSSGAAIVDGEFIRNQ